MQNKKKLSVIKNKKRILSDEKGSFAFYFFFIILAVLLLIIFSITIPIVLQFQTKLYASSEGLIENTEVIASSINDENIKTQILTSLDNAKSSIPSQIDILSVFYKYSWFIVILIITLVWFLIARRTAEQEVY